MSTFTKEITYNKDEWKVDEEKIIDFVEDEETVGANDVQKRFEISYQTAEKYLLALVSEGKLNKFSFGGGDRKYKRYAVNHIESDDKEEEQESEEEGEESEQEVEKTEQPVANKGIGSDNDVSGMGMLST